MSQENAVREVQQVELPELILNSKDFALKMQVLCDEGRRNEAARVALRELGNLLAINFDDAYRLLIDKLRAQDPEFDNFCRLNCRADGDFFVPLVKEFLRKYQDFLPPPGIMRLLSEKIMQGGAQGGFYFDFENLKILQDDELRSMIAPEAVKKWMRTALERVKEKEFRVDADHEIWKALEDERFAEYLPRDLTGEFVDHQALHDPKLRKRVLGQGQLLGFGSEAAVKQGLLDSFETRKDKGLKDLGREEYRKFFTDAELAEWISDHLSRLVIESRFGEFHGFSQADDALNDLRGKPLYKRALVKSMLFAIDGGDVFGMIAAMKSARVQQAVDDPGLADEAVMEASLQRALELEGEARIEMLKRAKSFLGREDAEKFLLQFVMDRAMTGDFESIREMLRDNDLNSSVVENPFVTRAVEQSLKAALDALDFKALKRTLKAEAFKKFDPPRILGEYLTRYIGSKAATGEVDIIIRILKEPGMAEHVDLEQPQLAAVKKLLEYIGD